MTISNAIVQQRIVYEIRCIFCKRIHRSEFFDEIEEEILACRDRAPEWQKGRLATFDFEDRALRPISPETTAYVEGMRRLEESRQ